MNVKIYKRNNNDIHTWEYILHIYLKFQIGFNIKNNIIYHYNIHNPINENPYDKHRDFYNYNIEISNKEFNMLISKDIEIMKIILTILINKI